MLINMEVRAVCFLSVLACAMLTSYAKSLLDEETNAVPLTPLRVKRATDEKYPKPNKGVDMSEDTSRIGGELNHGDGGLSDGLHLNTPSSQARNPGSAILKRSRRFILNDTPTKIRTFGATRGGKLNHGDGGLSDGLHLKTPSSQARNPGSAILKRSRRFIINTPNKIRTFAATRGGELNHGIGGLSDELRLKTPTSLTKNPGSAVLKRSRRFIVYIPTKARTSTVKGRPRRPVFTRPTRPPSHSRQ